MSVLLNIALKTPCHYCGARPGERCRAKNSRRRSAYTHEMRVGPIREAYYEGYEEGQEGILDAYDDHIPYFNRMLLLRREARP